LDFTAQLGFFNLYRNIAGIDGYDLAPVSPDGFKRLQKPLRDARAVNAS